MQPPMTISEINPIGLFWEIVGIQLDDDIEIVLVGLNDHEGIVLCYIFDIEFDRSSIENLRYVLHSTALVILIHH